MSKQNSDKHRLAKIERPADSLGMMPAGPRHFASDNNAGMCPEVLAALAEANAHHLPGYGDDPWTRRAEGLIRDIFETDCEVFFVFNGTAANCLALWS